jgi:hypothetical protein
MLSIIVCGGRNYADRARVFDVLDKVLRAYKHVQVVHGAARGADSFASEWALSRPLAARQGIRATAMPANWNKHGRAAGLKRNEAMLQELFSRRDKWGDKIGVVAFPGGRGTAHMRQIAEAAGVPVLVVE